MQLLPGWTQAWLIQLETVWGCFATPLQAELAEQGIIGILSHKQQHTQAHSKAQHQSTLKEKHRGQVLPAEGMQGLMPQMVLLARQQPHLGCAAWADQHQHAAVLAAPARLVCVMGR